MGQKFLSRSISEINAFYAEIHDGFWWENNFQEISPVDSRYPGGQKFCRNCSISLRFRDKRIFAFYTEIEDGRQKWREKDFCEKLQVNSGDTLWAVFETHAKKLMAVGLVTLESWNPQTKVASFIRT